ncbi:MAG: acylneuraminate cytidylyltransferase family protein [Clostridiales bacterium]|nr:acylneuraminate cytidylyltransferase family protein [Clostridiales bacterium]
MRYLVVIPARGGSKGIPHKNIYPIQGKPLLEYALDCISQVEFEGDVAVSTDDSMIAAVAAKYENVVVVERPAEISGDTAKPEAALIHALNYMKEQYNKEYDAVITLQATSPLRKSETVQAFLAKFEENLPEYDTLLTLSENRSDFWIKTEDGQYRRLYPDAPRRRQERTPLYVENSAIYATMKDSLLETESVLGKKATGYVIDEMEAVDINEWMDIYTVEGILALQNKKDKETSYENNFN